MVKTCSHLAPIEQAISQRGVELGEPIPSPYGDRPGEKWFWCHVGFDEPALRARLQLPECIDYTEYDGRAAGNDATFFCTQCKTAIMGVHPDYVRFGMVRIS